MKRTFNQSVKRLGGILASTLLLATLSGCTLTSATPLTPEDRVQIPEQPYHQLGRVHVRAWRPTLFQFPIPIVSMASAKNAAVSKCRSEGADAITAPEAYAEKHSILLVIGWEEFHFSGNLIKYSQGK